LLIWEDLHKFLLEYTNWKYTYCNSNPLSVSCEVINVFQMRSVLIYLTLYRCVLVNLKHATSTLCNRCIYYLLSVWFILQKDKCLVYTTEGCRSGTMEKYHRLVVFYEHIWNEAVALARALYYLYLMLHTCVQSFDVTSEGPKTATRGGWMGASKFLQNIWPLSQSYPKHKRVGKTKILKSTVDKST
jgi:hypothetical protein